MFECVLPHPVKKFQVHERLLQVFEKTQMPSKDTKPFEADIRPLCEKVKDDKPKYQTAFEALCEQSLRWRMRQEYVGELLSPFKWLCEKPSKVKEKEPPQGRKRRQEQDELVVEVFGPKYETAYRAVKGI